jgi:hypothetical protein
VADQGLERQMTVQPAREGRDHDGCDRGQRQDPAPR